MLSGQPRWPLAAATIREPTIQQTTMALVYDTVFPPEPAHVAKPAARPLPDTLLPHVPPLLACKQCNGAGHNLTKGFTCEDGKRYPSRWGKCYGCDGRGWFHAPDLRVLAAAIKGRKVGTLRSKRPDDSRAYYVWRLARFHGGKDVCLPMGAELQLGSDPYRGILDEMAQAVARHVFGSGNVGRARWQQAMYGSHEFSDLPATLDGPVYDAHKPLEEILETV